MNSAFTNQILQLAAREQRGFVRAISEDRHTGQSLVVLHEMRGGNDYWSVAYIDPGLGAYFYDIRDCGTNEEEAWLTFAQEHTAVNLEERRKSETTSSSSSSQPATESQSSD